ncbi:MAG: 4Fe-4S cluster-binding domain-containing protein [Thermoguttaceae bacterium]|nr:4Fe-4S cluster-binding domain-containing protein [Thermoguttaceae bacterium]
MRCVYCFKEKRRKQMDDRIAFDAMIWLIHASGEIRDLNVALIGGEPLLRFDLIKRLVPFAKRRAAYHGKTIHFSATTNNTLLADEIPPLECETRRLFIRAFLEQIHTIRKRNCHESAGKK